MESHDILLYKLRKYQQKLAINPGNTVYQKKKEQYIHMIGGYSPYYAYCTDGENRPTELYPTYLVIDELRNTYKKIILQTKKVIENLSDKVYTYNYQFIPLILYVVVYGVDTTNYSIKTINIAHFTTPNLSDTPKIITLSSPKYNLGYDRYNHELHMIKVNDNPLSLAEYIISNLKQQLNIPGNLTIPSNVVIATNDNLDHSVTNLGRRLNDPQFKCDTLKPDASSGRGALSRASSGRGTLSRASSSGYVPLSEQSHTSHLYSQFGHTYVPTTTINNIKKIDLYPQISKSVSTGSSGFGSGSHSGVDYSHPPATPPITPESTLKGKYPLYLVPGTPIIPESLNTESLKSEHFNMPLAALKDKLPFVPSTDKELITFAKLIKTHIRDKPKYKTLTNEDIIKKFDRYRETTLDYDTSFVDFIKQFDTLTEKYQLNNREYSV